MVQFYKVVRFRVNADNRMSYSEQNSVIKNAEKQFLVVASALFMKDMYFMDV